MKKKTWIWIAVIALFFIIIVAASGGSDSATTEATETTEAASPSKEWVELITLSGSGNKKSAEFDYSGGKARLRYNFQANNMGVFAVYVVKEGTDIMTEGGFPEVMLDAGEQGESNLSHLRKGTYYLNVTSANGKWTVTVEELK